MKPKRQPSPCESAPASPRHRVRLPGFLLNEDVGLGTVFKQVTSSLGIPHCDNCAKRAARLNDWLVFSPDR